jgi:hypothetical protein
MKAVLMWRMFVLLGGLWASSAMVQAEPYLAMDQNTKCVTCHVNPTGGGLRSEFGDVFAQTLLPASPIDTGTGPWLGHLLDNIRAGADLRADYSFTDVPHSPATRDFELEQIRTYVDASLIPSRLDLSVDEQLAPGSATIMEAYAKYTGDGGEWYLKGGKFYLPFGWRLQDNTAFVREVTGINMTTPDTGLELGWELPQWSAQLDLSNGAANTSGHGQQVSGNVVWVHTLWRVGLAAAATESDPGNRRMGGVFGGLHTGPLVWLLEGDIVRDEGYPTGPRTMLASLTEMDWKLRKGHNLKLTYEFEDPEQGVPHNGETRASVLYEFTPFQFLQLRGGYRRYQGIPQSPIQNQTLAFVEMHAFL